MIEQYNSATAGNSYADKYVNFPITLQQAQLTNWGIANTSYINVAGYRSTTLDKMGYSLYCIKSVSSFHVKLFCIGY